jgi:hypothetical protein
MDNLPRASSKSKTEETRLNSLAENSKGRRHAHDGEQSKKPVETRKKGHFDCRQWHTGNPTRPANWCTGSENFAAAAYAIAICRVSDATVIRQSHRIWGYATDVREGVCATRKKAMVDAPAHASDLRRCPPPRPCALSRRRASLRPRHLARHPGLAR